MLTDSSIGASVNVGVSNAGIAISVTTEVSTTGVDVGGLMSITCCCISTGPWVAAACYPGVLSCSFLTGGVDFLDTLYNMDTLTW